MNNETTNFELLKHFKDIAGLSKMTLCKLSYIIHVHKNKIVDDQENEHDLGFVLQ